MRACVQRVSRASVTIAGKRVAEIDRGLLVLLGVAKDDRQDDARLLAEKIYSLRIFDDQAGKMNLDLADVKGSLLVVSQFTLLGDCWQGRRPSFFAAAPPEQAEKLYEDFLSHARSLGAPVSTGVFRATMNVELANDGPVTLLLDSCKEF